MKLEDYLGGNRNLFDNAEPFTGHEDRFLLKLNCQKSVKKYMFGWQSVAAVITFFSLMLALYFRISFNNLKSEIASTDSIEFLETENYYKQLIHEKEDKIYKMSMENIEEFSFKEEMNEMDKEYYELKREFVLNPNNKQVVNALIYHLQTQVEILENIYSKIKNSTDQNI